MNQDVKEAQEQHTEVMSIRQHYMISLALKTKKLISESQAKRGGGPHTSKAEAKQEADWERELQFLLSEIGNVKGDEMDELQSGSATLQQPIKAGLGLSGPIIKKNRINLESKPY